MIFKLMTLVFNVCLKCLEMENMLGILLFIYIFVCLRACVLVVDRYIGQADQGIFQIKASADMFFCLDDVYEAGLLFCWG